MKMNYLTIIILFGFSAFAQSDRKIARSGNKHYESGNFVDAEIKYKKSLEKNNQLLEAQFNLGDALVKQERYEEALESFEIVNNATENNLLKANVLHNIGNVRLAQNDLEGAKESYMDALRLNPKDNETRYNYAHVKKLLQQEDKKDNQDQKKEDNQDKEKEDKKQDNQDQKNEDEKNENQDESNKNNDKQDGDDDSDDIKQNSEEENNSGQTDSEKSENNNKQNQEKKNKLSQEESKKILEALNRQENKLQEKLKKNQLKGKKIKIEKDW
tara:strand:- start:295 stop:1107 length:813 start_codon:yes stop_codon:yes gene_type:complete